MVQKVPSKIEICIYRQRSRQDLIGLDLKGKIAVMDRIYTKDLKKCF